MSTDESEAKKLNVPTLPEDGVGERIARVRLQKELTHDGLSQLTKLADIEKKGIARTTIRSYELGVYKPGAREIRILAAALEVSPTWLVLGLPDPNEPSSSTQGEQRSAGEFAPPQPRISWAKYIQSFVAFKELDPADKDAICNLILSLARQKAGEVEFRTMMAVFQELGDSLEDAMQDLKDGHTTSPDDKVVSKVLQAIGEKYGVKPAEYVFPKDVK